MKYKRNIIDKSKNHPKLFHKLIRDNSLIKIKYKNLIKGSNGKFVDKNENVCEELNSVFTLKDLEVPFFHSLSYLSSEMASTKACFDLCHVGYNKEKKLKSGDSYRSWIHTKLMDHTASHHLH